MAAMIGGPDSTDVPWECENYIHVRTCKHGVDLVIPKRPGVFVVRTESLRFERKPNRAERRRSHNGSL